MTQPTQRYAINIREPFKELERVDEALARCEKKFWSRITSVNDVTTIPNAHRVVLLVEFASGLKIKLVMDGLERESFENRQRAFQLLPIVVPELMIVGDGWEAFKWLDGPTLRQHGLTDELVRKAADLLLSLHWVQIPEPSIQAKALGRVHRKLKKRLPVLVWNNIIAETEHDEILNLSRSMAGQAFDVSFVHGDFSPDNLVIHNSRLVSIDNDKLSGHASDYDLVRAVNLWDEWNSSGTALFDAYCESSHRKVDFEHLYFWAIFDLVYRISYRIALGETNDFCKKRLRQILATGAFR